MPASNDITFAQMRTLHEVSQKVNSQLDLPILLTEIMDLAIDLLRAEKGLILLKDEASGEFVVRVARAMDRQSIENVVAMSHSIANQVGTEARNRLMRTYPDSDGASLTDSVLQFGINSVVCVPLTTRDRPIGVIYLDTTNPGHLFEEEDVYFLEAFANLAAIAIENAKSYQEIKLMNETLESRVDERTQELKQKNGELSAAYLALQNSQLQLVRSEKMASLGLLVAGLAHEINSPLGAISSNIDVFSRGFEKLRKNLARLQPNGSEEAVADMCKTLEILENLSSVDRSACERLAHIMNALRNFARLDEEEFKEVAIHDGLESALELIRREYADRIEIVKQYGQIPLLKCRARQVNQVFFNLLLNACQAIDGRGEIRIETLMDGGRIHLRLSDSGIGIPPENLSRIFDPGFTTKGVGYGTGLGLSIAHEIVKDHGGRIDVQSSLGKGTTFTLILPTESAARGSRADQSI